MVRIFLYGVITGMLLNARRKEIATKGILIGKKISSYVRESSARLREDWEDAVIEAEGEMAEGQESSAEFQKASQSS